MPGRRGHVAELERMRDAPVTPAELAAARDFLVGVFPLRFETPGPVVGALSGLAVHGLPVDELVGYRPSIEAVTVDDVQAAAARQHRPDPDGDRARRRRRRVRHDELEAAGLGPVVIERDEGPSKRVASDPPTAPCAGGRGPEGPTAAPSRRRAGRRRCRCRGGADPPPRRGHRRHLNRPRDGRAIAARA